MAKAYDRVSWAFLYQVLEKFGFPEAWIRLVRLSIENCWFSVLINGESAGFFKSSRGLRQGDPLSPALFIIMAEALSRGLDQMFDRFPSMKYFAGGGLHISHLAYADDIIIFSKNTTRCLQRLMNFLRKYEQTSGQLINRGKSFFILDKKSSNLQVQRVINNTGFLFKHLPFTYLGAPLFKGRKRGILFDEIVGKIWQRLLGWEKAIISQGGRLQLIKSVLSSMPIYLFQVVQPPKSVLGKIERLFNRFFWGTDSSSKKTHWTSWADLCYPYGEGGVGVRRLQDMVTGFSQKLWWKFRTSQSLWAEFLRSRYCKKHHPTQVKRYNADSVVWKRLCAVRSQADQQVFWRLGDGRISFWHDTWLDTPLSAMVSCPFTDESVNNYWKDGRWDTDKLQEVLPGGLVDQISRVPFNEKAVDLPFWRASSSGQFQAKQAWELIRQKRAAQPMFSIIWAPQVRPTISIFLLRVLNSWIPTDEIMKRKGFSIVSACQCCYEEETLAHIFLTGKVAREVWKFFGELFEVNPQTIFVNNLIMAWRNSATSSTSIRCLMPLFILWFLWCGRNASKHEGVKLHSSQVINQVIQHIYTLHNAKLLTYEQWKGDVLVADRLHLRYVNTRRRRFLQVQWQKPPDGWIKLNVDGSSRGNPGDSGAGGVVRNSHGKVIFAFHEFLGCRTSLYAELAAVVTGLQLCLERGFTRIKVEIDALLLIQILTGQTGGSWMLQHLLLKWEKLREELEIQVMHIYREANQIADWFANAAHVGRNFKIYNAGDFMGSVVGLLRTEAIGLPYFRTYYVRK